MIRCVRLLLLLLCGGLTHSLFAESADMAAARAALKAHHGAQLSSLLIAERLEYQTYSGDGELVWEGQGWYGSDQHKFWVKTEGELSTDEGDLEEAEVQALYSRAVSPFWDLQAGLRHDITPNPSRSYLAVSLQGLAPYWFEMDAAMFLSNKGDVSVRLEAEYELRLLQRLILQPRLELNGALSDDAAIGSGSGLGTLAAELRLRYQVTRTFAPYLGVSWQRSFGATRDFSRANDERSSATAFVAGIRFWY